MDWQQHYLDGRTPWDKGAPSPPLLEWIDSHPDSLDGAVFVPGCGMGHDNRAIAARTAAERIVGLDISEEAVKSAREITQEQNETYLFGDLFALEEEHLGTYDWVWEHTCFCAIEPAMRESYVDAVWSALKPGGSLLAVFYLDPYDDDHIPGEGPPHGVSVEELQLLFVISGRFQIHEHYVPSLSYPEREGLELVMRMTRVG